MGADFGLKDSGLSFPSELVEAGGAPLCLCDGVGCMSGCSDDVTCADSDCIGSTCNDPTCPNGCRTGCQSSSERDC